MCKQKALGGGSAGRRRVRKAGCGSSPDGGADDASAQKAMWLQRGGCRLLAVQQTGCARAGRVVRDTARREGGPGVKHNRSDPRVLREAVLIPTIDGNQLRRGDDAHADEDRHGDEQLLPVRVRLQEGVDVVAHDGLCAHRESDAE
eukprot:3944851-Prymnesium_polylepis.1